jgi:hypothetical protein
MSLPAYLPSTGPVLVIAIDAVIGTWGPCFADLDLWLSLIQFFLLTSEFATVLPLKLNATLSPACAPLLHYIRRKDACSSNLTQVLNIRSTSKRHVGTLCWLAQQQKQQQICCITTELTASIKHELALAYS